MLVQRRPSRAHLRSAGVALAGAFGMALLCQSPGAAGPLRRTPPPIPPVSSVSEIGLVQQNRHVVCRNGAYSSKIAGRSVWLFDDTCLTGGGVLGDNLIDNSLAASVLYPASAGIRLNDDKQDANGVPVRFVPFTENEIDFNAEHAPDEIAIWPAQLVDDWRKRKRELIFFDSVYRGPDIGVTSAGAGIAVTNRHFSYVERPVQSLDPQSPEPTYMWSPDEQSYTGGYLKVAKMLYCYGGSTQGLDTLVHVARVPLADALDKTKWTYWTGTEWSDKNENLATVYEGGPAGDTLFFDSYLDEYVTVYQRALDNNVYYRVSDHPQGPWSDEAVMFTAEQGTFPSYGARVHAEFNENGGQTVYVTYVKTTGTVRSELPLVQVTFGLP